MHSCLADNSNYNTTTKKCEYRSVIDTVIWELIDETSAPEIRSYVSSAERMLSHVRTQPRL